MPPYHHHLYSCVGKGMVICDLSMCTTQQQQVKQNRFSQESWAVLNKNHLVANKLELRWRVNISLTVKKHSKLHTDANVNSTACVNSDSCLQLSSLSAVNIINCLPMAALPPGRSHWAAVNTS